LISSCPRSARSRSRPSTANATSRASCSGSAASRGCCATTCEGSASRIRSPPPRRRRSRPSPTTRWPCSTRSAARRHSCSPTSSVVRRPSCSPPRTPIASRVWSCATPTRGSSGPTTTRSASRAASWSSGPLVRSAAYRPSVGTSATAI
jgi:hypothetical protein